MDRLDMMQAFAAVAGAGSFAEAARRMRASPSAVSRAVAELEAVLGIQLLSRTTRSVRLTERGAVYLESCRQILEDVESAARRARGQDAAPQGLLTVTAPLVFGRLHVLPIVQRLLTAYPALDVRLLLSDRNAHLSEEGIDVAIRIGALADSSLISLKVGAVSPVLIASPSYLAAHGLPQTPAELSHHALIAFEGTDMLNEWRFGHDEKPVRIRPRLIVDSADAAILAAEAGMGIARTLSYQVEDKVRAGELVLLLENALPGIRPVTILYPPRRIASDTLNAFLEVARTAFKDQPIRPASEWCH